jgi:hypothetical protein
VTGKEISRTVESSFRGRSTIHYTGPAGHPLSFVRSLPADRSLCSLHRMVSLCSLYRARWLFTVLTAPDPLVVHVFTTSACVHAGFAGRPLPSSLSLYSPLVVHSPLVFHCIHYTGPAGRALRIPAGRSLCSLHWTRWLKLPVFRGTALAPSSSCSPSTMSSPSWAAS